MAPRLELQTLLETITDNVYFQPPASVLLTYPCIVYRRSFADTKFADDKPYSHAIRYEVMVIDRNPDSEILKQVAALPMCVYVRYYPVDGLNHDIYNIFF